MRVFKNVFQEFNADTKAGKQRIELDITLCWASLADLDNGWLAVALDSTSLGERFVV